MWVGSCEWHVNRGVWVHIILTNLHWWLNAYTLLTESPSGTYNCKNECDVNKCDVNSDESSAQETALHVEKPNLSRNLVETLIGAFTHTLQPNRKPLCHSVSTMTTTESYFSTTAGRWVESGKSEGNCAWRLAWCHKLPNTEKKNIYDD